MSILSSGISFPVKRIEEDFAHPHMVRSDFHKFILLDILQRFLKGEFDCRRENDLFVTTRCPDVGELLGLADIDIEIPFPGMLADNLASVNLLARLYEEPAAIEKLIHRVSNCFASLQRDQRSIGSHVDISLVWLVILEPMCNNGLSLGRGKEVAP